MTAADLTQMAVLVPARQLEPGLAPMLRELSEAGFGAMIVVDDGISATDQPVFAALQQIPRVHLLRHAVNLGKGRALKTGINFFLDKLTGFSGLITADADGQHAVSDIVRVAEAMGTRPRTAAVLGCRAFSGDVPLRSRLGNSLTRVVFHFFSGHKVTDTQTGLRAFSSALLPELLALPGERYEYEMTVLAHLSSKGIYPVEIPIQTIYIDGNRSSSFQPLRDSMRIYFVLLRFFASSLISAGLDLVFFTFAFWLTHNILTAMIAGRLSSLVNFALNRKLVFHSHRSVASTLWRYYLLAILLAGISYGGIRGLSEGFGWNVVLTKILVESVLFLLSFSAQRLLVFGSDQRG
ncbi:MAG: bifunctional glycosyltransferase family 2/GtrA family protein [Acidobacteriaceae bacterium]|nr:bifunctional glycosyltransferase family 2/GtrA family protein [Acidobacteriaceae bacterium]